MVKRILLKSHDLQNGTEFCFSKNNKNRYVVFDYIYYKKARSKGRKKLLPQNQDVIIFATKQ